MSRILMCLAVFSSLTINAASAADKKKTTYQLPKDVTAVVISFDQQSGFTRPRQNAAPVLSILADGTVQMPDLYGQSRDVTAKSPRRNCRNF